MRRLRVEEIARTKGFTMARLEREAGVDIKTIRKIWHNKPDYNPLLNTLDKIARVLGVSTRDLLMEDEEQDNVIPEESE